MKLKEDISYPSSREIGNIVFKVIDTPNSLEYVLLPKTSKDLDKISLLKQKYKFTDSEIQETLAGYLSQPNLKLEPNFRYNGAGFGLKLVKPKLG